MWSGDIYSIYDIGMWGLVLHILFSLFFLYKVEEMYLDIDCVCTKCVDLCVTEVLPSEQILHVQLG